MITIKLNPLGTYQTGIFDQSAAEIPAYDETTQRLFVVNANQVTVDILDLSDPANPVKINEIDASEFGGVANSVDVKNGLVVVAVENNDKQQPGRVAFFNSDADDFSTPLNVLTVGALPDMVTFTPDGNRVAVANEGEPNQDYTIDPVGSISIIDVTDGVENIEDADVQTASFEAFNEQEAALKASGVRIFGPSSTQPDGTASVAQDLEPEYIAINSDSQTAYVTLQENNALAVVDLDSATVLDILPLGFKDYSQNNKLDASDEDGQINITNWPVLGMYQPDSIESFEVDGATYLITANEGDSRVYPTEDIPGFEEGEVFNEESRIEDLTLDPEVFPDAAELQQEENLGRLKVTNTLGDTDGDGDFEQLYSFGARSFSIWDTAGNLVFDSGDRFEQDVASAIPEFFNSTNDDNDSFDNRSDDKGPEPEGVTIGEISDNIYAFIGLERVGGVMVYDITNPTNPEFVQYINNRNFVDAEGNIIEPELEDGSTNPATGDLAPEGLTFISAEDSPNGQNLLAVANEVSGTTTIFEIKVIESEVDELAFGTTEDDFFDTANPNETGFIGEAQQLFTGEGNDTVDVSLASGNNRIDLGSDPDLFFAGSNNRVLAGSSDDILFVANGDGNNTITGEAGNDQFWIVTDTDALPVKANTITDFTSGEDVIGFANTNLSYEDLNLSEELVNNQYQTTINALGQDLAVLLNTQVNELSSTDFVFA